MYICLSHIPVWNNSVLCELVSWCQCHVTCDKCHQLLVMPAYIGYMTQSGVCHVDPVVYAYWEINTWNCIIRLRKKGLQTKAAQLELCCIKCTAFDLETDDIKDL